MLSDFILILLVMCVVVFIVWLINKCTTLPSNKVWYVRYPDGERTFNMDKKTAQDYRDIFGGVVYRSKDQDLG